MQYDSAAVYIKHLADVDSCNLDNVCVCALFLQRQNSYKEAESYYNIILEKIEQDNCLSSKNQIALYNNLALLYYNTQRFKESEEMYLSAIDILERLVTDNPGAYEFYLVESYTSLACLYRDTQRFNESEEMLLSAIAILEHLQNKEEKR